MIARKIQKWRYFYEKRLCALIIVFALAYGVVPFGKTDFLFFTANAVEDNSTKDNATAILLNVPYEDSLVDSSDENWYYSSIESDGFITLNFEREVKDDQNNYWTARIYKQEENLNGMTSLLYNQYNLLRIHLLK